MKCSKPTNTVTVITLVKLQKIKLILNQSQIYIQCSGLLHLETEINTVGCSQNYCVVCVQSYKRVYLPRTDILSPLYLSTSLASFTHSLAGWPVPGTVFHWSATGIIVTDWIKNITTNSCVTD